MRRRNRQAKSNLNHETELRFARNNMTVRARTPLKLILGLIGLLLGGLWFLAGGATDVYRTGVLLRKIKQPGELQVIEGTVTYLEHPWFAFSLGRGGHIWYRVHYHFVTPQGSWKGRIGYVLGEAMRITF